MVGTSMMDYTKVIRGVIPTNLKQNIVISYVPDKISGKRIIFSTASANCTRKSHLNTGNIYASNML